MPKLESQHIEWKVNWRDDYLRWICGFANAQGGRLEIGKNDEGEVVGLPDAGRLLEDLPNKMRDLLGRQGRTWDGVPLPQFSSADLSSTALARFRKLAARGGRLDAAVLAEPDAGLLEKLRLMEGAYFKRATVLLFHAEPDRFVTGAFVKVGFFRSETELVYHDEVHGDLFAQVQDTLALLLTKYLKAVVSYDGIQRIETFPVPQAALREALLNALVHRDYAVGAPVQIRVYDDHLKIWNPAVLPDGWTLAKLLGEHASSPFNPAIANAFFRAGEIEAWGRGVQRIFEACRAAGAPEPVLRYEPNDLWLEFPFSAAYLKALDGARATTEQVTEQVARFVALLKDGSLGVREAMEALGLRHRPTFLANYLRPALKAGLVEMTQPESPKSPTQKYRLVTTA